MDKVISDFEFRCCTLCPRECKADRTVSVGFCGMNDRMCAAKAMVHYGEEPCISGKEGSGAVFFSGCVLHCEFCQNSKISHEKYGSGISVDQLCKVMLRLQSMGVNNINIVSGTQFYPLILSAVDILGSKLKVPLVWNTGGYEKEIAVERLSRYFKVFLQDMKFYSSEVSKKYARCSDYFHVSLNATKKMIECVGAPVFDSRGVLQSGVVLRHLVLPSNRKDSIELLKALAEHIGTDNVVLSLMSQYTPPNHPSKYRELNRRVTTFEYDSVCDTALSLGFNGYFQGRESAESIYTPCFDLEGLF